MEVKSKGFYVHVSLLFILTGVSKAIVSDNTVFVCVCGLLLSVVLNLRLYCLRKIGSKTVCEWRSYFFKKATHISEKKVLVITQTKRKSSGNFYINSGSNHYVHCVRDHQLGIQKILSPCSRFLNNDVYNNSACYTCL